jgi:hypothetical protein
MLEKNLKSRFLSQKEPITGFEWREIFKIFKKKLHFFFEM